MAPIKNYAPLQIDNLNCLASKLHKLLLAIYNTTVWYQLLRRTRLTINQFILKMLPISFKFLDLSLLIFPIDYYRCYWIIMFTGSKNIIIIGKKQLLDDRFYTILQFHNNEHNWNQFRLKEVIVDWVISQVWLLSMSQG